MPGQNNPNPSPSPFEIVSPAKSKKGGNRGLIITITIVVFLILSVVAGVLLVRQQQNIQEKAAGNSCPAAEACPDASQPSLLRSCHPGETDGSVTDSNCDHVWRIETCGPATTQYCCPAAGAAWTTDMTACQVPTPTATATASPTPTAAPNTCNGTCGSDSNCQSGLICSGGFCRSPLCTSSTDCTCGAATPTPTATASVSATPTKTPSVGTPRPIPVTGTDWPTVTGIGVGIWAIIISILIAL